MIQRVWYGDIQARLTVLLAGALCTPLGANAQRVAAPAAQMPIETRTASAAGEAVLARVVSLRLNRTTLGEALRVLEERAGTRLIYSPALIPLSKRVSLVADAISVRDALHVLLVHTGLEATTTGSGRVALQPTREGSALAATVQQGGGTIGGRVVDGVTRGPLDQVAVRVEALGLGTVTTRDGDYAIRNVPPGTYRVTARRVGYIPLTKTVTVSPDSAATVDFALAAAPTKLNEVVTTAVGDQRRYEVGNVISTINADSIAPTAPITSLTDLISARAPGVVVEETGGVTGSGEAIRIRGQSSLVLQGDPILIVDGVRQDNSPGGTALFPAVLSGFGSATPSPSRLNDLNFADIESIDLLKGPAASTEYGTDAANGVIVITTKHGTAGRPQWHGSAEVSASAIPVRFPTLYYNWGHTTDASHTPVRCPLLAYFRGSGYGSATGTCAVDSVTTWNPLNNPYYSIFGTGHGQKYDLSVTGGSDAIRYYISGGLSNDVGVLQMPGAFVAEANVFGVPRSVFRPNGEDQRSVRANTAIRLGATADLAVTGAYLSTYQAAPNEGESYNGLLSTPPLRDSASGYGYGSFGEAIPIYQLGQPTNQTVNRLAGGMTASWRPTPWFVGHGTIGVDHGSTRSQTAILPQVFLLDPFQPSALGLANMTTDIYTVDLRGSAPITLTPTIRATTSIGLQLADQRTQGGTVLATGITSTNFTLNGAVNPTVTQIGQRQATLGGYGEEQIRFADRLFVTGALRVDAGSGFGHSYSTAVYPKGSVSWLAVNSGSTTLRFRGAFGASGVQPPNGAALQLYTPSVVWNNGGPASSNTIANVQNEFLQPERSVEYEGGFDAGLWQNRMSIELTGYSKTTRNALVSAGTGWDAGGFPYTENVGEVRNAGVEGVVTAAVVRGRALSWDLTLNASLNHNKLLALAPGILSQQLYGDQARYRFTPNYPLYGYWGPRVQYTDLNHDGVIEPNEIVLADSLSYVGSSIPTREASLGTHLGLWGGAVSVGALVDYRGGLRLANMTALLESENIQSDRASNDRTAPLWEQARNVAAQAIFVSGADGYAPPAGFYEDATYLRFRELSVTYTPPHRLARALRLEHVSLTGAVRNLALWTRYTGADPEVVNSSGFNAQLNPTSGTSFVNNDLREDLASVPLLRYWLVRLNMGL